MKTNKSIDSMNELRNQRDRNAKLVGLALLISIFCYKRRTAIRNLSSPRLAAYSVLLMLSKYYLPQWRSPSLNGSVTKLKANQ
jgi:amino acid permease